MHVARVQAPIPFKQRFIVFIEFVFVVVFVFVFASIADKRTAAGGRYAAASSRVLGTRLTTPVSRVRVECARTVGRCDGSDWVLQRRKYQRRQEERWCDERQYQWFGQHQQHQQIGCR